MDLAKVIVGVLLHIVFALGLSAGGGGMWYVDHRPAFTVTVPHWGLPPWRRVRIEGLMAERDAARADAATTHAQLATLEQAARLRPALVEPIVREAKAGQARAVVIRRQIMSVPPQDDACRFARAIDEIFLETLSR